MTTVTPTPMPPAWRASAARERLRCQALATRPRLDDLNRRLRAVADDRARRLARRQAALHRCDGCGTWLLGAQPCAVCPAIAADRATNARLDLTTTTTTARRTT